MTQFPGLYFFFRVKAVIHLYHKNVFSFHSYAILCRIRKYGKSLGHMTRFAKQCMRSDMDR